MIDTAETRSRAGVFAGTRSHSMQQPLLALKILNGNGDQPQSDAAQDLPRHLVPLRDWSAAALLDVISATDAKEKRRAIRQLLTVDPAVFLWAVLCRENVHAWKDVTVDATTHWLLERIDELLLASTTTFPLSESEHSPRFRRQQLDSISSARNSVASLNGRAAEIGAIVYAGAVFSTACKWIFDASGEPIESGDLPSWLRLLVDETSADVSPSIEFMKPIWRSYWEPAATQPVSDLERRQWETDFPIIRSVFRNNLHYLQQLQTHSNAEAARVEAEKLAALKEFAYGASHEINNPLANISTRAQLLMRGEVDGERKRQLATITRQAYRAHEMIADLMLFAKPPKPDKQRVCLSDFLHNLIESMQSDPDLAAIEISVANSPSLNVEVDPAQLDVALRAIVRNSAEACGSKCCLQIDAEAADGFGVPNEPQFVEITIADDGPGLSHEARRHLFDPFYSGREAGRGLGFGLPKAWRIVEQHGGEILVDSSPSGTAITLRLPRPQRTED